MDTRQKIIETAYNTFYQKGFHACGVELLAQNAGITKRTLYAHFGSKDGLIDAVLDYRHEQFIANMQAALAKQPKADTVSAYLGFIRDWTQADDFYGCLFINATAEYADKTSTPYQKSAAHKRQIREILFERLAKSGVENAKKAAENAFLIGEGMIIAAQTGQADMGDWERISG